MAPATKRILKDALELSVEERAEIAAELLASLEGEPDPDVEAAWAREIETRAERALRPDWKGEDWSVVRERLRTDRADCWPSKLANAGVGIAPSADAIRS